MRPGGTNCYVCKHSWVTFISSWKRWLFFIYVHVIAFADSPIACHVDAALCAMHSCRANIAYDWSKTFSSYWWIIVFSSSTLTGGTYPRGLPLNLCVQPTCRYWLQVCRRYVKTPIILLVDCHNYYCLEQTWSSLLNYFGCSNGAGCTMLPVSIKYRTCLFHMFFE